MTASLLIVAAGRGARAGGPEPKQWQALEGRRVIDWTLDAARRVPGLDSIVVVLHPDDMSRLAPADRLHTVPGGATRAQSVRNGLEYLADLPVPPRHVLIHDAARCCVAPDHIASLIAQLQSTGAPALAPALGVTDALWHGEAGLVTGTRDRAGLYRAQTPQAFDFAAILAAHRAHPGDAADDVEVARAAGLPVRIVEGHETNLKITTPGDFARAAQILRARQESTLIDIRTGTGFDVHRFGPGDHVTLCGVDVPHSRGLQGHSDADVGLHALTDAIYGALALGDIGRHFPPSDPQWKGAASHIFLRHAAEQARAMGFTLCNVDVTLICEYPKIGPHAPAMIAAVAEILGIEPSRVSVKATTSERLGFTGREEGIAAQAVATLVNQ